MISEQETFLNCKNSVLCQMWLNYFTAWNFCQSWTLNLWIVAGFYSTLQLGEVTILLFLPQPTQAPGRSTSQQQMSSRPGANLQSVSLMTSDLPRCQILKRLVKIIGMQPSEGQGPVVLDTALRILFELARMLSMEDAFRYVAVPSKTCSVCQRIQS